MPDDLNLPLPAVPTPTTDITPPPPPVTPPPLVAGDSAYGTPPTEADLQAAEAKAQELVGGSSGNEPLPKVGKKTNFGPALKIGGSVLGLVLLVGGVVFGTGLAELPFGAVQTGSKASSAAGDGLCPDERPANHYIAYECDEDTNNDGQCNPADDRGGRVISEGQGENYWYSGSCGQADIFAGSDFDSFCGTQGHDISGCGSGGGGGGGGGTSCTDSETCPGKDANGQTVVCGPTENCIVRDTLPGDIKVWGCKADKACVEDTPTPSHEPPSGLVCKNLRANPESPKIGEAVRFICRSDGTRQVDHFEFRYKIDKGEWLPLDSGTANAIEGKDREFRGISDLTITQAGDYKVQCRVCKRADGNCTDWGQAH